MGMGVDFKSLRTAVDWSILELAIPKANYVYGVQQYVGNHYSHGGSEKAVPTNFIELAIMLYMQQLAARAPRCTFNTEVRKYKPWAYATEIELNKIPKEIGMDATLRRAVMGALFGYGVVKTGMCSSGVSILEHDIGESFADLVGIDDYFCDMSAKTRSGIQFEGNDYWVSVDDARAMWEGKDSDIEPDQHTVTGDQGEKRVESISTDEGASLYKEKVWLRDVWIKSNNKLVTYGVKSHKVFNIIDWDGPKHGPYHMLGYSDVPGNLLPLPPVAIWMDLHELANNLFRKLGRQADAKKTFAALHGGSPDDKEAIKNVADGEGVDVGGARAESMTVGGIDAPTLAFYIQSKDLASYFGGNWDALGGLGRMSETVGQDEMMQNSANARLEFMRDRTLDFAKEIFEDLAWYRWTDPTRKSKINKPVKGSDISVPGVWSYETRDGDWLDYNFDLDVYSMQSDSPSITLQKILSYYERVILPGMPIIEQQGGSIDFRELNKIVAKLSNTPELNDILVFGEPSQGLPEQGNSEPTKMAPNTTRNYHRTSSSEPTRHGKDDTMSKILMGSKVQPAEGAHLGGA